MATIYRIVGRRIAERRKALSLTQEELAEKASIGTSYVARIEAGSRKATLETLTAIARALGVTLERLFADGSGMPRPARTTTSAKLDEALGDLPPSDSRLLVQVAQRFCRHGSRKRKRTARGRR